MTTAILDPGTLPPSTLDLAERVLCDVLDADAPAWVRADLWAAYHRVRCHLDPPRPTRERDAAVARQVAARKKAFPMDASCVQLFDGTTIPIFPKRMLT